MIVMDHLQLDKATVVEKCYLGIGSINEFGRTLQVPCVCSSQIWFGCWITFTLCPGFSSAVVMLLSTLLGISSMSPSQWNISDKTLDGSKFVSIFESAVLTSKPTLGFVVSVTAAPASPTATDAADVHDAQATAVSESPTSNVKGKAFDRYVSIWFENTDYDMAAGDRRHLMLFALHSTRSNFWNSKLSIFCKQGYNLKQ